MEEAEFCNNIILIDSGKLIAEGSSGELKSKYITNSLYEIECTNIISALEIIEKESFVDDTSIFGNNIHISVNENFSNEDQIHASLSKGDNIEVIRIDKIVPTLEDVFIKLMDKN